MAAEKILVKLRCGQFEMLPEDKAKKLVKAGRAAYYDLHAGKVVETIPEKPAEKKKPKK